MIESPITILYPNPHDHDLWKQQLDVNNYCKTVPVSDVVTAPSLDILSFQFLHTLWTNVDTATDLHNHHPHPILATWLLWRAQSIPFCLLSPFLALSISAVVFYFDDLQWSDDASLDSIVAIIVVAPRLTRLKLMLLACFGFRPFSTHLSTLLGNCLWIPFQGI